MALSLPTDTQHLRLETRQYELFNRPLGQGIVRRRLYLGVVVCLVWVALLLLVGVNPLSRLGPAVYIAPPFAIVYLGTRVGDDGRMAMMRWYDALLARLPGRRACIRNPLLGNAELPSGRLRIGTGMTELHPRSEAEAVAPLVGRRPRRDVMKGGGRGGDATHKADV
jgi:hypothetical protein